jgi:hypothetical protein
MHPPRPVQFQVNRSQWHRVGIFCALATALVFAVPLTRYSFQAGALMVFMAFVMTSYACWRWVRGETGMLRWTGEYWLWSVWGDAPVGSVHTVLDFQAMLLIRLISQSGKRNWIWLESGDSLAQWRDVRRSLAAAA